MKVYFKPFADVDECSTPGANNCSSNADCVNEPGLFKCVCRPGYTGDGMNCNGRFLKDGVSFCYCAYDLYFWSTSRYSGFLRNLPSKTTVFCAGCDYVKIADLGGNQAFYRDN